VWHILNEPPIGTRPRSLEWTRSWTGHCWADEFICELSFSRRRRTSHADARLARPERVTDAMADLTAGYYDRIAVDYDGQVDGLASNRATRAAFCTRVSELAGASSTILDFGCGTGTDAAWYAAKGHHVVAYDVSAGMVDVLRRRCATEIAAGSVTPIVGDLGRLDHALQPITGVDAVAANFAALNHVADLEPVFAVLASHLRPGGVLVANLLNPLQRTDVRHRWWFKRMWINLWRGTVVVGGAVVTYRHQVRTLRRMARRWFTIEEIGHADEAGRWSIARLSWRELRRREFRFFVLRKHV
jgi:SAM-dependent methyltransferase